MKINKSALLCGIFFNITMFSSAFSTDSLSQTERSLPKGDYTHKITVPFALGDYKEIEGIQYVKSITICNEWELGKFVDTLRNEDKIIPDLGFSNLRWFFYLKSGSNEAGKLVGITTVHVGEDDPLGNYAEIQYFVASKFRHQGIGFLMAKETVNYVTQTEWYHKPMIGFVMDIAHDNDASKRIARKLDMGPSMTPLKITREKVGCRWFKYL